jgi:hypothetical protein
MMPFSAMEAWATLGASTQTGSTGWIVVGWIALAIAFVCAGAILLDIVVGGHRQRMAIMNWVYPITALYWGPVAVWFYVKRGRRMSVRWARQHDMGVGEMQSSGDEEPRSYWAFASKNWWPISKGTSHCGAGCTLGDIVGEGIVYLTAWSIPIFAAEAANSLTGS